MRHHRASVLGIGLLVSVSLAGCVADSTKSASDTPASSPIASAQGKPAPPAAPSRSSGVTEGAAGKETGGSDAGPPVGEGEPALPAEAGQVQEPTVSLTQAVHFTDAKGQDVVVGPGSYRVDAEGTNRIRLLPAGTAEAVVIDAVSFTHQETVEHPFPVTVPDPQQPDVLHLALLSPGGTGLDASGTYSGVKPRAVTDMMFVTSQIAILYTATQASKLAVPGLIASTTGSVSRNPGKPTLAGLPGEFAIRTAQKHTYLTARDGGHHSVDAIITTLVFGDRHGVGPYERFKLARVQPDYTTIQTMSGYYLSIAGSPDVEASSAFQTELMTPDRDTALFRVEGPFSQDIFTIRTFNGYSLIALDGGGKSTGALHYGIPDPGPHGLSLDAMFSVVKCGDLGSGYRYGIKPAGGDVRDKSGSAIYPFLSAYQSGGQTTKAMNAYWPLEPQAAFTLIRQGDGSYALQTANRINYVTAVGGGGLAHGTPTSDNLHTDATQVNAWEKFRIVEQGDCTYTIQTVSGFYLAVKSSPPNSYFQWGGISTRISDPNAAPSIGYTAKFELVMLGL